MDVNTGGIMLDGPDAQPLRERLDSQAFSDVNSPAEAADGWPLTRERCSGKCSSAAVD